MIIKNTVTIFIILLSIVLVGFLLNQVGARFPSQDWMVNDFWAISRLDFFIASAETNPFSVINFSEGFGVDIRSDIKTQIGIFDVSTWLSLFTAPEIAINLKMSFFIIIGFMSFIRLLDREFIKNKLVIALGVIFSFNILYFSETSTLTTTAYALTPLTILMAVNFLKRNNFMSLLYLSLALLLYVGNLDLNALFILPLIYIWLLQGNIYSIFSKPLLTIGAMFLLSFLVVYSGAISFLMSDSVELQKNNLIQTTPIESVITQVDSILKTFIIPRMAGPVTLFLFPPLLAFLLKNPGNITSNTCFRTILSVTIFSIIMPFLPYFINFFGENIPSIIRYHFGVLGILIFISMSQFVVKMVKDNKFSFRSIHTNIYKKIAILVSIFIIIYGQDYLLSFISATSFLIMSYLIHQIIFNPKSVHLIALLLFQIMFMYSGHYGGFFHATSRTIDPAFGYYYGTEIIECVNKTVGNSGAVIVANNESFPGQGRHDLSVPLFERPDKTAGRIFFQWRHSYPYITAKMYQEAGATGNNMVTFSPPTDSAFLLENFWRFLERSKTNYIIGINSKLNKDGWERVKTCKANISLKQDRGIPAYKEKEYDSFEDPIYIYKKMNSVQSHIKYSKTNIIIDPEYFLGSDKVELPIIYFPYLEVNMKEYIDIKNSADGFVILEKKANSNIESAVIISSNDWKLYLPFIMLIPYLISIFLLSLIFNRPYKH